MSNPDSGQRDTRAPGFQAASSSSERFGAGSSRPEATLNGFLHAPQSEAVWLGPRVPRAKYCADCDLEDCGLEPATAQFRGIGPPRS
eukprot:14563764-Alexandrium_andersonii.AAC.2